MSQAISTPCVDTLEFVSYRGEPWRVVEAQHQVATRSWVGKVEDQYEIEEMIDAAKPPLPSPAAARLHYLLFTPFRYPPLRHGSRFGGRHEPSLWYGSEVLETALAEVAFWRISFLEGSEADLEPSTIQLSAFQALVASNKAVDLTKIEPRDRISDPNDYGTSQAIGSALRARGAEILLYHSARDAKGGRNVALYTPDVFRDSDPTTPQTWTCVATKQVVEFSRRDYFERRSLAFRREQFETGGRFPNVAG